MESFIVDGKKEVRPAQIVNQTSCVSLASKKQMAVSLWLLGLIRRMY